MTDNAKCRLLRGRSVPLADLGDRHVSHARAILQQTYPPTRYRWYVAGDDPLAGYVVGPWRESAVAAIDDLVSWLEN